jgi:hypothetical protein
VTASSAKKVKQEWPLVSKRAIIHVAGREIAAQLANVQRPTTEAFQAAGGAPPTHPSPADSSSPKTMTTSTSP